MRKGTQSIANIVAGKARLSLSEDAVRCDLELLHLDITWISVSASLCQASASVSVVIVDRRQIDSSIRYRGQGAPYISIFIVVAVVSSVQLGSN